MALSKEAVAEIVKEFGRDEQDSGSTPVQVALMSKQISELTEHLKTHKNDHHSRRGLLVLVGKRRRLLDYLKRVNRDLYLQTIDKLNLRK